MAADGGGRHLEFIRIENSAVRSAVPENPTLEPNMKWIGSPVAHGAEQYNQVVLLCIVHLHSEQR